MKITELLKLDGAYEENIEILKDKLRDTPMFKKNRTVKIETLEKVFFKFTENYYMGVSTIMPSRDGTYAIFIRDYNKKETVKVISAKFYEEGLMKALIYMYAYCQRTKGMKVEK